MRHWERSIRRTAAAMLGVILLGGSLVIPAQASSQGQTPDVQEENGTGKTTIRGTDASGDWSYQQVAVNSSESDIMFPSELKVQAVVEQGTAADVSGVTVLRIVSDLTQTYTSTELRDITVDVLRWKIDTSMEGCTGSNFNSSKDGNVYFYTPVLADKDREGNTLHWNQADLPYITVLVGEGVMPMADTGTDPDADPDPPTPPTVIQSAEAHGLKIATETQDEMDENVELLKARSCFRLKNGGSFTVLGQWKEATDKDGTEIAPNTDPMITIIGATKQPSNPDDLPKFTIYFGDSKGVLITPAAKFGLINKPIIKVQGFCEVELVVAENTTFTCSKEVPAVDVPKGSAVRIRGGSGKAFNLDGNIRNLGTLTVQGMEAALEVKGKIENKGSFRIASKETMKALGSITNEGELILEQEGLLDGSGTFVNFGNAKLVLGEKSTLKTGAFINEGEVNIPRSVKVETVGGGDFENNGKLRIGGDSDVPGGTLDPGKGNLIVDGSMTNNSQDMRIEKQGNVEVSGNFTNAGKVVVSNWTLPVSGIIQPTVADGGTLLVGKTGSPEVKNDGRIEIGEGGLLTSNMSGCKVINTGELSLASVEAVGSVPSCLGSNIKLQKGKDATTGEESGEFYLTDITSGMVLPMEDIAYNGENHYNTLFQKCAYKKLYNEEPDPEDPSATWDLPDYEGITFQVTPAQGWGVDLYNNSKGNDSVNKSIRFSSKGDANGNYYVVYKNVNRRKDPAFTSFHMFPATLSIDVNGTGKEIPKDHPDYQTVFQWDPEEEEVRKGYSLGENMEIRVNLAIETRIGMQANQGDSLKVTIKEKADPTHYLTDTGRKELNNAAYTLSFDKLGISSETIKVSTLFNGAPIKAGIYEVEIQYDEPALNNVTEITVDNDTFQVGMSVINEVSTILHPTKANELYVLRTFPEIDISRYSKDYTYGDEIPNPDIDAVTAIIRNYYGNAPLECEWYKTDDLEQVKKENDAIKEEIRALWTANKKDEALALKTKKAEHFVGSEFPTKEFLENNGEYEGVVAGDYVLRVMLGDDYDDSKFSTYSAPGEIYQRIHVNTKLATLRISMDPGPSKVYGEPDEPIEYEAEGLVGDDVLNGQLGRARDRENVDSSGNQGEDRYDKVGSYLINTGTINTNLNKNYEIVLASSNYQFQIVPKDLNWNTQNLIVAEQDNRYKVYGGLTLRGLESKDNGYVGVTYDNLVISEDGKSLEVTNPKVIDIYGNEESKYASNYNPPRSNTIPIDETIYRLSVTEGSITHLSEALKKANQTVPGITSRMTSEIKTLRNNKLGYKSDSEYKLYDVKIITESGETVEDIFQKGGLMVTIPYPEGTSKSTHNFVAIHMISSEITGAPQVASLEKYSGSGGTEANGETFYKIEKTDEGLVIKVTGLSPVAVAWAPTSSNPDDPNNPDNPDNPNNPDDPNGGNNNGTNSGNNNGTNNGTNSGNNNGTNSGTNSTDKNNNSTDKNNNNANTTTNKNGSTTQTSGVNTGDNAPILFYSISALAALLLLIFIICMARAKRKEE